MEWGVGMYVCHGSIRRYEKYEDPKRLHVTRSDPVYSVW